MATGGTRQCLQRGLPACTGRPLKPNKITNTTEMQNGDMIRRVAGTKLQFVQPLQRLQA
jgi:hypothetical protein